jgi:pyruvate dehydrogenase complex dehydrogenase (E1) component
MVARAKAEGFNPDRPQTSAEPAQKPAVDKFQATQDSQAQAAAASAGIVAQRGMQQLDALQQQRSAYVEQFSDVASDLIVSTEAEAWMVTAEKVSQKLGSYSPVDTVNVFTAFSLDLGNIKQRLQAVAEPAALCAGKATAGF